MKLTQWLCRLGLHAWAEAWRTTKYVYQECRWCGSRQAEALHPGPAVLPLDRDWLRGRARRDTPAAPEPSPN